MGLNGLNAIGPQKYKCAYCDSLVANDKGYFDTKKQHRIYVCPNCNKPTYFDEAGKQYPGATPGNEVGHLPKDLQALYREARDCCSVSAYTASVLACRKLLMNITVQQGAKEGLRFIDYVSFLAGQRLHTTQRQRLGRSYSQERQ